MNVCKPTVLLVDDEPLVIDYLAQLADDAGFTVATAVSGADAVCRSREHPIDLALVDVRLPGVGGLEVMRAIREKSPECQIVVMTGYPSVETAVNAIKSGARDYVGKPFDVRRVERLLQDVKHDVEDRQRSEAARQRPSPECYGMIGGGDAMQRLFASIRQWGPYARTALISGETGVGKELVARALHKAGRRADKRFVTINCSAVVESLFESELFGHVRGAFTGATEAKPGLFEVADGGVLFLDEVGELPLSVQAKLLRVLELGEFQRVGAVDPRRVDVQIVAATNRDLRAEVAAGRFRRDLYYRLNVVELRVPPLRERREDIPDLANAFLRDCAVRWAKTVTGISPSAQTLLMDSRWDGNVRELRNVVERACLLADGPLVSEQEIHLSLPVESGLTSRRLDPPVVPPGGQADHLPVYAGPPAPDSAFSQLSTMERAHILRVLQHAHGNKKAAARILGVSRRALYRRLERLGLEGTISRRPSPEPEALDETLAPC